MEWPKLKNIILIILVVTNLGLMAFVGRQELHDSRARKQARSEAIQFLADRGVRVAEEQVPQDEVPPPQKAERDLEREGALAAQLLAGPVQAEDRGGGVYRYFNEKGSIQFHSDGAFQAQFAAGAFPLEEDRTAGCLAALERMGFQGELLEDRGETLVFRQMWNGWPLFSQQVTLHLQDGCLTAMAGGRRLVGEPEADLSSTPISVVTALIDFLNGLNLLGDVCSRIDTITQGYVASTALSGPMALTPVWRIATDTGSYQLDMLTGELSRVEVPGLAAAVPAVPAG